MKESNDSQTVWARIITTHDHFLQFDIYNFCRSHQCLWQSAITGWLRTVLYNKLWHLEEYLRNKRNYQNLISQNLLEMYFCFSIFRRLWQLLVNYTNIHGSIELIVRNVIKFNNISFFCKWCPPKHRSEGTVIILINYLSNYLKLNCNEEKFHNFIIQLPE